MRFLSILLGILALSMSAWADDAPKPIREKQVLPYLDQLTEWQRTITALNASDNNAREVLLHDVLSKNARKILQNGFDFARAEAAVLTAENPPTAAPEDPNSKRARLLKRIQENAQRIASIQAQQADVNAKLARATRATRTQLQGEQERLAGDMKLAQAERDLLKTVNDIFSGPTEEGGLIGKINALSRTVLEEPISTPASTTATLAAKPAATPDINNPTEGVTVNNGGIIGLTGDLFALARKRQAVDAAVTQTEAMKTATTDLIASLRSSLQLALKQGTEFAATPVEAKDKVAHRKQLDALVVRYKQLAAAVVPLGQVSFQLDGMQRNLGEWEELAAQEWKHVFHQLLLRLGVLVLCILVPILLSDAARRATQRYVQDPKRKAQLRILRRVVFGFILVLVIILNFVTEFGSLATFAGFLTAGLAVALQTVLLSLVAHFFFFGRFGVRAGDRVTISGVTGDVIQVGMLRIYLMELKGAEGDMRATGKIVAFPNSVLFSSTAFSKQVPGTSYAWKDMTFLIDPECDYKQTTQCIMDAVDAVYGEYKEAIELQHQALEQSTRLTTKVPAPKSELRFAEGGLAFVVHYPVVLKRASEIYERVTQNLIECFARKEGLRLKLGNPLRVECANDA